MDHIIVSVRLIFKVFKCTDVNVFTFNRCGQQMEGQETSIQIAQCGPYRNPIYRVPALDIK